MMQNKRVIALGFFDGMHIGHAALIRRVLEISRENKLIPSITTFDAHPQCFVSGKIIPLINSPEDRTGLLRRIFRINDMILLHFDKSTVSMPWDEFIDHLTEDFGAIHLVAGNNFRFGNGGNGNSKLLAQKCVELGIGCDIIPDVIHDGVISSSTYIRELLTAGDMERANEFLGHPHVLTDIVRYGYKLGRTLGTPTINMCFPDGVSVPAFGVYATKVFLENKRIGYTGVTNIGIRPTVDDSGDITAETHILNFERNLYGCKVRLEFYKYLRPEIVFDDVDKLKAQILKDCEAVIDYFASI